MMRSPTAASRPTILPTILVVDDRPENLYAMRMLFKQHKLEADIIESTSGEEALSLSLEHDFALAIVDVQMPEMNGYELVSLLHGNYSTRNLPVIFVSAIYSDTNNFLQGYNAGAVDFMTKPFIPEILLSKVRVFLDLYRQRLQMQQLIDDLEKQKTTLHDEVQQREAAQQALKDANARLSRRSTQLETSYTIGRQATSLQDRETLLKTVVEDIQQQFCYDFVGLWWREDAWLELHAHAGLPLLTTLQRLPLPHASDSRSHSLVYSYQQGHVRYCADLSQPVDASCVQTAIDADAADVPETPAHPTVEAKETKVEAAPSLPSAAAPVDASQAEASTHKALNDPAASWQGRSVLGEPGSVLFLPLHTAAEQLGVLVIENRQPHSLDEDERLLLQSLSQQLATSLRNIELYEAEKRLRREENEANQALLQTLMDYTPAAMFVKDTQGCYALVNRQLAKLYGLSVEAMLGKREEELQQAGVVENSAWYAYDSHILQTGTMLEREVSAPRSNEATYLDIRFPIRTADGRLSGLGGVALDISARKRAEERAERTGQLLQAVLESTESEIAAVDNDHTILAFNSSWQASVYERSGIRPELGMRLEEVLAQPLADMLEMDWLADNPLEGEGETDLAGEVGNDNNDLLLWDRALSGEQLSLEQHYRLPTAEKVMATLLGPIRDEQGQVRGAALFASDISERKRVEQSLRDNQHFIQAITSATPMILYVLDLVRQHHVYTNRDIAEMLGYSYRDAGVLGEQRYAQLMHPEDLRRLPEHLARLAQAEEGERLEFEYRLRHADDSWRWFYSREVIFRRQHDGTPRQVLGVTFDITDRRRAEEALRESEQRYRRLITLSPDAVFVSIAGQVVFSNPQGLSLLAATHEDEVLGMQLLERLPEGTQQEQLQQRISILQAGEQSLLRMAEYRLERLDRHIITVEAVGAAIEYQGEKAVLSIMRDVSERKRAEEELRSYREHLEQLVQERTEQLSKVEAEVKVTRQLQSMLLPNAAELQALQGLDIAAYMQPAAQVGGDYYDVLLTEQGGKIGIGDVTGHGLESGVLMLMTQTAVRTLLHSGQNDPVKVFDALNKTIYDNVQRMHVDKSLTLALLDYSYDPQASGGQLRLSGQHESLLLLRGDGRIEIIDTLDLGMPLGLDRDIASFVQECSLQLQPGDTVVLYTDGITEAENGQGVQYGMERLCRCLEQPYSSAQALCDAIIKDVYAHIGMQVIYDDITLLVLKQC